MGRRPLAIALAQWAVVLGALAVHDPAHADWAAIAESKVFYTDDVFQFSAARRLALSEDPSQPTVVPLDKPQDVVWEPSIEVIKSSSLRLGRTELSFKAHGFVYTENPIFNHGNYRLQLKQALTPETSILLRYRYVPNLFLGPNVSRQFATMPTQEERVTSHVWRAQLERRLAEDWTLTLVGRFGLRLYNDAFAERDTRLWTVGPQLGWAATSWATFTLAYLYERGLADGRGDTRFNDDVSYRQHFVSLTTEFQMTQPLSLKLSYVYRLVDFTSDLIGDSNRGREDMTHQGLAELRYRLTNVATLTLGFQRTQRTSSNVPSDFHDTIYSIGGQYRF